ncbi:F-box protein (macronuclear) [Tetrahymena thermophila SB210]|uniref:F-box protein n=1 Tax=Tetrahymena thermophila (strain SB210) TaxID=312017 RepID=Q24HW5_TETTS|nr:F-box protein [Tetrahymena thermophila SB210]EAS07473.2 F-box protein [Tetrahymena thermophila SB210]|eukprot:XP_001027715.2 F-box protein [Tetrahymena thermophila SB210]
MYKSVFNLPCSCNLMRNGNLVPFTNSKGKGKRIHLYACFEENSDKMSLSKHPYLQLEPSSSNDSLYKCGLYQISKVHQTFIQEGKITIDVVESQQGINVQLQDISLKNQIVQKQLAHLCVVDSTQESLKLFLAKLSSLIQFYSQKQKQSSIGNSNKDQESHKKQISLESKQAQQEANQKNHFQFKAEKRVSINQMKINLQQSVNKMNSSEKKIQQLEIENVEVDKKQIEKSLAKSLNKLDQQNIFQQQAKEKEKQQQQLLKEQHKKNKIDKYLQKQRQVEDVIIELHTEDEDNYQSKQPKKIDEINIEQEENKLYTICEELNTLNGSQNATQEKTIEQLQLLQVSNKDQNSDDSIQIKSPQMSKEISNLLLIPQNNKKSQSTHQSPQSTSQVNELTQSNNKKYISPRAESVKDSSETEECNLNRIYNENQMKELENQFENQSRQMLQEEDNLLSEQKKILAQQQLMLCEKQLVLMQQEKLLRKQQLLQNQMFIEDSLNQEEIKLIQQKEVIEKQIKEYNEPKDAQNNLQMQKYFLEQKNIEQQYENEQKYLQAQAQSSLLANNSKFMGLQNKLQEIKNKQQQKKLEDIKQQASGKKNLYKVDRSITKKTFSNGQTLALKRRNPFSMDDENEDENFNNPDQFYVQATNIQYDSQENNQNQKLLEEQKHQNNILEEFVNPNNLKSQVTDFQNQGGELLKLKDGINSPNLPSQFQSVKKLGNSYIFEKNSFKLKIQDDDSLSFNNKRVITKGKINSNLNKDSQSQNSQTDFLKFEIQKYLAQLPEHVMAQILMFLPKKQLYQVRTVSKFFDKSFFLSIRKLVFLKRDTPCERVLKMIENAKYIHSLQIGQLANLKPDSLIQIIQSRQSSTLKVLDLSNYMALTPKLFLTFIQHSKQIQDISIPFFSRVTDQQLYQLDNHLNNLQRLALKSLLDNFNYNDKISDQNLAKIITDLKSLNTFEVFTVNPSFLERIEYYQKIKLEKHQEKVQKNIELNTTHLQKPMDDIFERITCLKIRNMVMTRFAEDDMQSRELNLQKLGLFKNLRSLKIVNIVKKSKGEWFLPYTPSIDIIKSIFQSCQLIQHLSLGQWCTNETLQLISEQISNLKKIRIIGNQVDDTGLEFIFQKMEQLQIINISDATRINGHCFESIISRNIQEIKVKFDDYRLNCLHSTITHILNLNGVKITNYTK